MNKFLGIAVIAGSLLWWAKGKVNIIGQNFVGAVDQLQYKIAGIKGLKWVGGITNPEINFNLDLTIVNPTNTNFILEEQNALQLSRIDFMDANNNVLAQSYPGLNSINLPAQGEATFKNIPVKLPVSNIGGIITQLADFNPNNLNMRISLMIAGKEITID